MAEDKEARRPVVVTPAGGRRYVADIRGHKLATDQPPSGGGEDSAPMPLELFAAALGSCIALYVGRFCETRGVALDGLRVEVDTESAREPYRLAAFEVRVVLPEGLPEHYRDAIEHVARSCPAHGTLTHPARVEVVVADPAAAAP